MLTIAPGGEVSIVTALFSPLPILMLEQAESDIKEATSQARSVKDMA